MGKREINSRIVDRTRQKLRDLGIFDKLDIFPVENISTRRSRNFTNQDGKYCFKVLMWTVNSLSDEECDKEIDARIKEARGKIGI